MELVLLALVVSIGNILCFFYGARISQKMANKEEIKLPSINPIEKAKQFKISKEYQEEIDKCNKVMNNIDAYNGTSDNQEEV